jgi:hypothetical protein
MPASKKSTSGRRTAAVGGIKHLQSMKPLARATDRLWLYETTRGKREFSQLVQSVIGPEGAKSSSTSYDITGSGHCELESVGGHHTDSVRNEQQRVVGLKQREYKKMEDAARMALLALSAEAYGTIKWAAPLIPEGPTFAALLGDLDHGVLPSDDGVQWAALLRGAPGLQQTSVLLLCFCT